MNNKFDDINEALDIEATSIEKEIIKRVLIIPIQVRKKFLMNSIKRKS